MDNLDKAVHILKILRQGPWVLWQVVQIGAMTAQDRYIRCCVGRGTVLGTGTEIINTVNVNIGVVQLLEWAAWFPGSSPHALSPSGYQPGLSNR